MSEYILDVICNTTYSCVVEANSLSEAEEKAKTAYNLDQLYKIDEGIVEIDLVEVNQ